MAEIEKTPKADKINSTNMSKSEEYLEKSLSLQHKFKVPEGETSKDVLGQINHKDEEHQQNKNISLHHSYSKSELPYMIKCRNRYIACKKLYEQRFQYEIQQLIAQQPTGYEAARLNRHLCITTMWPPWHSRSEIAHTKRYFFSLNDKQRKRLNWIMSTNII